MMHARDGVSVDVVMKDELWGGLKGRMVNSRLI